MSWEKWSSDIIQIKNVGTVYIDTYFDDWNRFRKNIYLKSETHHIETEQSLRKDHSVTKYYAVPNGLTINHKQLKPKYKPASFQALLAISFTKDQLVKYAKSLQNKKSKFTYKGNRRWVLSAMATMYYDYYSDIDKDKCLCLVKDAVENYETYPFTYVDWEKIKHKLFKRKYNQDKQVKQKSHFLYSD